MNENIPDLIPDHDRHGVITLPDPSGLRQRLAALLADLVKNIVEIAKVVREAEDTGVDLSDITIPFFARIRDIAYGKLLPEVFALMPDRPGALQMIARLPAPIQREIAEGKRFEFVVPSPLTIGKRTLRKLAMQEATDEALRRLIANGHIRSEAEQNGILDEDVTLRAKQEEERVGCVVVDHVRDGGKVGNHFIPRSDLEAAVAALRRGRRGRGAG